MQTLETERLLLRGWDINDADDLYAYAKNPKVGPDAGWEPHASKEVSLSILHSFIEKDEVWAIVHKEDRKVIGSIGLHPDKKRDHASAKMLGYVLSEDYWRRGLMTEAARRVIRHAFEAMGTDLLSIYHFPFNARSKRVIEKCGFRYEGTLRQAYRLYDGQFLDEVCYSLLKDEYFGRDMNASQTNPASGKNAL